MYLHADETSTLVGVLKFLRAEDFTKMLGSGLIVSLQNLDQKNIVNDFMIPAEDMEEIKLGFISSLESYLARRALIRQDEIRDIKNVLKENMTWLHGKDPAHSLGMD